MERTPKVLKEIRGNSGSHAFPSKFYIKSVLEAYPTFFTWQHVYNEASSSTLKTSLQTAVLDAKDALAEDSTVLSTSYVENQNRYLESSLNLIQYELAHTAYNDAFALLHALSEHVDEVVAVVTKDISSEGALDLVYRKDLLSTYFEFLGLEANLRSNIEDAAKHYKTGASFSERNTSVKLKLASLHLDLGEHEEAKQIFDHLLALWSEELETANTPTSTTTTDNEDDAIYADARSSPNTSLSHGDKKNVPSKEEILFNRAWVYIHRASLFIARDAEGNYREDAIEKAISDLDNAIKDTGKRIPKLFVFSIYTQDLFPASPYIFIMFLSREWRFRCFYLAKSIFEEEILVLRFRFSSCSEPCTFLLKYIYLSFFTWHCFVLPQLLLTPLILFRSKYLTRARSEGCSIHRAFEECPHFDPNEDCGKFSCFQFFWLAVLTLFMSL